MFTWATIVNSRLLQVFVFSPKGDLYALPKGSTLIDFAYRVHSELGNRCVGGKVNGRMVPIKHEVANGDTVQVLTSKSQTPHSDWLGIARTSKAQARIRAWIKAQQRLKSVELGAQLLQRALEAEGISAKTFATKLDYILVAFGLPSEEQLLAALGYGHLTVDSFMSVFDADLAPDSSMSQGERRDKKTADAIEQGAEGLRARTNRAAAGAASSPVMVGGERNMLISFCKDCKPLYGDDIRGVITRGRGIKVSCVCVCVCV